MPISDNARSAEAIHRKLRAIAAVLSDPAATEHERADAETLKMRLEKQIRQETTPEGTWTDIMFRLGRLNEVGDDGFFAQLPARFQTMQTFDQDEAFAVLPDAAFAAPLAVCSRRSPAPS
jgi:hypothetical protein